MSHRENTRLESLEHTYEQFMKKVRSMGPAPARLFWDSGERGWRLEIVDQVLDICDRGIFDGEVHHELLPASKDVLILVCRVKLGLREFSGRMNTTTIARELRISVRTAQLAFQQLERHELILVERSPRNETIDVRLHENVFCARWYIERMRKLSTSYQQAALIEA